MRTLSASGDDSCSWAGVGYNVDTLRHMVDNQSYHGSAWAMEPGDAQRGLAAIRTYIGLPEPGEED
jgi:hypothetical protein